jgi:hypothetical protein
LVNLLSSINLQFVSLEALHGSILKLPENPYLIDSEGRRWHANLKRWGDGRILYTGGWSLFCRKNNVREEDYCICEFVEVSHRKELDILINVVRHTMIN